MKEENSFLSLRASQNVNFVSSGMECSGVHEAAHSSVLQADADVREELYANMVLSGGSSMFPGMAERMQEEVSALAPPNTNVQVRL